jgi:hypothetical protein
MKALFPLLASIIVLSCGKDQPNIPNSCPGCIFSTELNNSNWEGIIIRCVITFKDGQPDTLFRISISEMNPIHDDLTDALILAHIPYDTGTYVIDTGSIVNNAVYAEFRVYEYEKDYITQQYFAISDGESFIDINQLDKTTGKFKASFYLKMSIEGGENGELHNSSYPKFITFSNGLAEGIILKE